MTELTTLPNIGPKLAQLLREAGIPDGETLRALGCEQAVLRLAARHGREEVCLHKVTALEGAIQDVPKKELAPERKAELNLFYKGL
ncbi:MAG: TfoX/Sxy family DNA transformation protein [Candidatus Onthomonas sp.]